MALHCNLTDIQSRDLVTIATGSLFFCTHINSGPRPSVYSFSFSPFLFTFFFGKGLFENKNKMSRDDDYDYLFKGM
jgi:hypothetical protein